MAADEPRRGECSWLLEDNVRSNARKEVSEWDDHRYEFADGSAVVTDHDDWDFGIHREWLDEPAVVEYCRREAERWEGIDNTPQFILLWPGNPRFKVKWTQPRAATAVGEPKEND